MKILLKHINNTFNYGSMMMAENTIAYLNLKLNCDTEFYIDAKEQRDLDRLKKATKYEKIYFDLQEMDNFSKNKTIRRIQKLFKRASNNNKIRKFYDYVIFLGGDDFSEFYIKGIIDKIYIVMGILELQYLNKNKNVVLLGQTVGPYTGLRKFIAKRVFPNIKVYTRDDINLEIMKKEYGISAKESRDLAFLDLNLQEKYINNKNKILGKYNLSEDEYITVVGTELLNLYCSKQEDFMNGFVSIVKKLKEKYLNKKIVWLSHVTSYPPNLSDNYLLNLINSEYDKFIDKNMVVISERMLPVEARIILGGGYLTVTCRMHAAVSTFQMKKPAICLSYSPKYKGVIADGLNMHDLVIEAKSDEIWKNDIAEIVLDKTDYIDKNYFSLQKKIKSNVEECKVRVSDTLNEIAKDIISKSKEK